MSKVEAIVLAAGISSRMKRNKLLLKLQDKSIIEHLVSNIQKSNVNGITVVLGYMKENLQEKLEGYNITFVENTYYKKGMSTSIIEGIKNIIKNEETDGVLIFNGDMPFIQMNTINFIIEEYKKTNALIVVPNYKNRRGHPVLFDKKFFPELLRISGDVGAREILHENFDQIYWVEVNDPGINMDIDNLEDYQKAIDIRMN